VVQKHLAASDARLANRLNVAGIFLAKLGKVIDTRGGRAPLFRIPKKTRSIFWRHGTPGGMHAYMLSGRKKFKIRDVVVRRIVVNVVNVHPRRYLAVVMPPDNPM